MCRIVGMNIQMLELYTDYLISSFGQTTATGLSAMLNGEVVHDKVTRFLSGDILTSKQLWQRVKPIVKQVSSDTEDVGVLIFDDTIQAKPHTKESDTMCWHYDHSVNRHVKGINILNCLYHIGGVSIPIAFDIITKPRWFSDLKTKKTKRESTQTKNERLRQMFDIACHNRVNFRYVLMDSWFTSKENLVHIRKQKKHVIAALKSNRTIALSLEDKLKGNFTRIDTANLPENQAVIGYMKGYPDEVCFIRQVFTNKDDSTGTLYLVSTDVHASSEDIITTYQKRWEVEVFHKSLKQNANLAKSPTRTTRTQHNHVFLAIYAVFKLECLKIKAKLNHFALRTKLLINANQAAYRQLKLLSGA